MNWTVVIVLVSIVALFLGMGVLASFVTRVARRGAAPDREGREDAPEARATARYRERMLVIVSLVLFAALMGVFAWKAQRILGDDGAAGAAPADATHPATGD